MHIHPSYPMFSKAHTMQLLLEKAVPDRLLNAIFALSLPFVDGKEKGLPTNVSTSILGERFAQLAARKTCEQAHNAKISLDDVRTEVLLTLYEFTTFHSRRGWIMAGNVTRMAVGMGLHRIDSGGITHPLSAFEMEEHRFVWWSVWKLDTEINAVTGTPFGADGSGTALVSTSIDAFDAGICKDSRQQFLPSDLTGSWKSAVELLENDTEDRMSMYLFATHHLRSTMTCLLSSHTRPTSESVAQLAMLRNHLICLRFSLPEWYFEPGRRRAIESAQAHRLRLESLLILLV